MADFKGQRRGSNAVDIMALADEVNAVVGQTATKINSPGPDKILVLNADKGGFRVRLGDFVSAGMPGTELPATSITDGSGGLYIAQGQEKRLPNPSSVTVKGYAADSVLTYYWQ